MSNITIIDVDKKPNMFFDKSLNQSEAEWALMIVEMNPDEKPEYGIECQIAKYYDKDIDTIIFFVVPK